VSRAFHGSFTLARTHSADMAAMRQLAEATVFTVCFGCGLDVDFNETDDHGVCPDCRAYEAEGAAEFRDDE
jgi:predicted RNA-binding Zn-ribbon protein involved in translation (DUF1610 family)